MKLGIRLLLGVFLIVGLAAYFVLSTFSKEVKPGVRQGMEVALVDTANLLAELAAEDMAQNNLQEGLLAAAFARYRGRDIPARQGSAAAGEDAGNHHRSVGAAVVYKSVCKSGLRA